MENELLGADSAYQRLEGAARSAQEVAQQAVERAASVERFMLTQPATPQRNPEMLEEVRSHIVTLHSRLDVRFRRVEADRGAMRSALEKVQQD